MNLILRILLYPFALLYDVITRLRNHLYNQQLKPSIGFDLPVICVGNLTVGGTGKTPHIEYLIRLLKETKQVATLSRGYGRKTRGFLLASEAPQASSIGDEPMQFHQKYGDEVVVAVGEQRAFAIPSILQSAENTEIILLDDAYQHRKVRPSFNILLSDYNRPFYQDYLLPAGRLRESRVGAKRAQAIIVSKCPSNLDSKQQQAIEKQLLRYAMPNTPIFFTSIRYAKPIHLLGSQVNLDSILLVTGIAKAEPFKQYVSQNYQVAHHLELADHISYTDSVIEKIKLQYTNIAAPNKAVLTTEKDAVKLQEIDALADIPIYYIPIEVYFLGDKGSKFDQLIHSHIKHFKEVDGDI